MKARRSASTSSRAKMPKTFTRDTRIGTGWRCSQALRAFFEAEIGPSFHFNHFLRTFIKSDGIGQPLAAAIDGWRQSKQDETQREIAPQFEYNRHFREYFAQNPQATRDDAIRAWHEIKATRKTSQRIEAI